MLRKKTAVVATGVALALATAAIAFAYWTNSGTGSGTAASGDNSGITVKQTSTPSGLYPGGPAATLSGNFDNPNSSKVFVHQVTAALASVTPAQADPSKPACTVGDFALSDNPATVDAEVDPGTAQGAWGGIHVELLNSSTNQDNCKGVTLGISYSSN